MKIEITYNGKIGELNLNPIQGREYEIDRLALDYNEQDANGWPLALLNEAKKTAIEKEVVLVVFPSGEGSTKLIDWLKENGFKSENHQKGGNIRDALVFNYTK